MARRDDGGTFFSARRNRPALERALSDLAPAPWKQTARDTSSARNTDSTIKRFAGDPRLAAALLPLAQTILGGLLSRLALGGIAQGARAVRLSDGSIIRVVTNSGIHVIEIDCRAASAPSGRIGALHHPRGHEQRYPCHRDRLPGRERAIRPHRGVRAASPFRFRAPRLVVPDRGGDGASGDG